jgi:hypothetical protein
VQKELGTSPHQRELAGTHGRGWQRSGHMVLVHGCHGGNSSSRWRAAKWSRWDAVLGWLGSELDFGPKSKVAAHDELYNFYLKYGVIRAMD